MVVVVVVVVCSDHCHNSPVGARSFQKARQHTAGAPFIHSLSSRSLALPFFLSSDLLFEVYSGHDDDAWQ